MWQAVILLCVSFILLVPGSLAQQGEDEYSYTDYPSSLLECGREDLSRPIYVCDPNKILKEDDARQMDVLIETVMNETECRCSTLECSKPSNPGFRIAVAIVKKMKLPKTNSKGDPVMNVLDVAMPEAAIFANNKLKQWNVGRCADGILIFYSMLDQVLYTVTEDEAKMRLQPSLLGEIGLMRRGDVRRDPAKGLRMLLSDYKAVLLGMYRPMARQDSEPKYEAVRGGATSPVSMMLATIITIICTALSHVF